MPMPLIRYSDLLPNPFEANRYPLKRDTIETIKKQSEAWLWRNLLSRPSPTHPGKYELVKMSHILVAMQEMGIETIEPEMVPIYELGDNVMVTSVIHGYTNEWPHDAAVDQDTVRLVVEAFAEERIALPKLIQRDWQGLRFLRIAPSFQIHYVRRDDPNVERAFTTQSVADLLKWQSWRVNVALAALSIAELGIAGTAVYAGLSRTQAQAVIRETRRIAIETADIGLARVVAEKLASGMRRYSGNLGLFPGTPEHPEVRSIAVKDAFAMANRLIHRDNRTYSKINKTRARYNTRSLTPELLRSLSQSNPPPGADPEPPQLILPEAPQLILPPTRPTAKPQTPQFDPLFNDKDNEATPPPPEFRGPRLVSPEPPKQQPRWMPPRLKRPEPVKVERVPPPPKPAPIPEPKPEPEVVRPVKFLTRRMPPRLQPEVRPEARPRPPQAARQPEPKPVPRPKPRPETKPQIPLTVRAFISQALYDMDRAQLLADAAQRKLDATDLDEMTAGNVMTLQEQAIATAQKWLRFARRLTG